MRLVTSSCLAGALALLGSNGAWAQSVISAHSGLVHYVEGRVLLADKEIDPKFGQFPEIKKNEVLKTEDGRAEVLLSPGVFLRVAENSSIRMINNDLSNTRIEVLTGRALVESASETLKDDAVSLQLHDDTIRIAKNGLYEIFAETSTVRVYQGEADVESPGGNLAVSKGREATLSAKLEEHKFDTADTDDLYSWTSRRSGYLAAANVSSAKTMSSGGGYGYAPYSYGGGGFGGFGYGLSNGYGLGSGYGLGTGIGSTMGMMGLGGIGGMGMMGCNGWAFNPIFGMYTYVPCNGMVMNPFGYAFFSPQTVGYALPYYYSGGSTRGTRVPGIGGRVTGTASSPYALAAVRSISHSAGEAARVSASSYSGGGYSRGNFAGNGNIATAPVSTMSVSSAGHSSGSVGGGHR